MIAHRGAYLNWVKWMLESFEFQMLTHDMIHWAEPAGVSWFIRLKLIGKPAGKIAVEFGGFFCERLIQFHMPVVDEEPAVQESQSSVLPPNSQ